MGRWWRKIDVCRSARFRHFTKSNQRASKKNNSRSSDLSGQGESALRRTCKWRSWHWNRQGYFRQRYSHGMAHQEITRAFICRLTQYHTSYKALYDKKYFIALPVHVMLFKAYPTYICFLSHIYLFLKEHIFPMTYSVQQHIILNNKFSSTTYFFIQHVCLIRHTGLTTYVCFWITYICHWNSLHVAHLMSLIDCSLESLHRPNL